MLKIEYKTNKRSYAVAMSQGRASLKKLGVDIAQVRTWNSFRQNKYCIEENADFFYGRLNALSDQERLVLAAILFAVGRNLCFQH